MKLKKASDYRFVKPDDDAFTDGAHPFTGDIMPRRSDKSVVSYEDYCFLQEACGELCAALEYFTTGNGSAPARTYMPFGSSEYKTDPVPRALWGAGVGRFVSSPRYSSPGFAGHYPEGYVTLPELRKFLDSVGTDVRRLFNDGMVYEPNNGYSLEDLTGYPEKATASSMGYVGASWAISTNVYYDVFFMLVRLAYSVRSVQARASVGMPLGSTPLSFGAAWIGAVANMYAHGGPSWGAPYCRAYEELSFHDGFAPLYGNLIDYGEVGRVLGAFVKPGAAFGGIGSALAVGVGVPRYDSTSDFAPSTVSWEWTVPGIDEEFTSADLQADDALMLETVVHDTECLNMAFYHAMLKSVIGGDYSVLMNDMGGTAVDSGKVNITEIAEDERVTKGFIPYLFEIPARCSRIFVSDFKPKYAAGRGTFSYLFGDRSTVYDSSTGMTDTGPLAWQDETKTGDFGIVSYYKTVSGDYSKSWTYTPDGDGYDLDESSTSTMFIHIQERADKGDNAAVAMYYYSTGPTEPERAFNEALAKKEGGAVLGTVEAVQFVTVRHSLKRWKFVGWDEPPGSMVEYSDVQRTFAIRYTLTNPEVVDGRIVWRASKTPAQMVTEALGFAGLDKDSAFETSWGYRDAPLPDASHDERMPMMPSPPSPTEYSHLFSASCHFVEDVSVEVGCPKDNEYRFRDYNVHMALAGITPRTAEI